MDNSFFQRYYGQLAGFTIRKVTFEEDDWGDVPFPVLHLVSPAGVKLKMTLSSDTEGNSAGFAFVEEDNE